MSSALFDTKVPSARALTPGLVLVLLAWGTGDADADVDGDGLVAVNDLVQIILAWGPCE